MSPRPAPRRRPASRKRKPRLDDFERLVGIVEKNTARISRLEDLFAIEAEQQRIVQVELELIRAQIERKRR